jgi:phytoene dehydrogenase-like protein
MTSQPKHRITVVGGGLAGLVAAISCAEHGANVELREATGTLGGRARSLKPPFRANLGPHALYTDGSFWDWLRERKLLPPVVSASATRFRFRKDGRLRILPPRQLVSAAVRLRGDAPTDLDYRSWATAKTGEQAAQAAIDLLSLPTYDADPGRLSAGFAQEIFRRVLNPRAVRYVVGGWSTLIERLAAHARALGATIELDARVEELPAPPVIVALPLPSASRLLGDTSLNWPGAHLALLDLGVASRSGWPSAVLDLDEHVYAARYSASDSTLAPPGRELIQASAGIRDGETHEQAQTRIEQVIDSGYPGWRDDVQWQRALVMTGCSGALDPPGASWRDRPKVDRGDGVFIVGDHTAAPGLLSEVATTSACDAASRALAQSERRGAHRPPTQGDGASY